MRLITWQLYFSGNIERQNKLIITDVLGQGNVTCRPQEQTDRQVNINHKV